MTSDNDLRLVEERVREHLARRAAAITPDTLGPARPPHPEPARRRFPWLRLATPRTVAPLAAGAFTVAAVLGWALLAPESDDPSTVPPGESVTVPATDTHQLPTEHSRSTPETPASPQEPSSATSDATPSATQSRPGTQIPTSPFPLSPPPTSSRSTAKPVPTVSAATPDSVPPAPNPSVTGQPSPGGVPTPTPATRRGDATTVPTSTPTIAPPPTG